VTVQVHIWYSQGSARC